MTRSTTAAALAALLLAGPAFAQDSAGITPGSNVPQTGFSTDGNAIVEDQWIDLFNGEDLTGWTPKFTGHELGVNLHDTFRVTDGLLTVAYDNWDQWDGAFGHLFYETPYSHYKLRAEFRFAGDQVPGGPGWAFRNNGFMIHGQTAESMTVDQDFPNSIEVQLLGGPDGDGERACGNLCTPGTNVVMDGELVTRHVVPALTTVTVPDGEWATVEIHVHGGDTIQHYINGELVHEYQTPQLDDGTVLTAGTISIQAESAPIQFRTIQVLPLDTE